MPRQPRKSDGGPKTAQNGHAWDAEKAKEARSVRGEFNLHKFIKIASVPIGIHMFEELHRQQET